MRESGRDEGLLSCMECGMPVVPFGPYHRGDSPFCKACLEKLGAKKLSHRQFMEFLGVLAAVLITAGVVSATCAMAVWLWRVALR